MGTLNTTIKQFIVTASANTDFRAIVQMWHDFFGTTCGFTQAADSGQINPSTVNFPGSNNSNAGQEVWYFADALQSTKPIAIRIHYGRGADANDWRIQVSVSMSVTNGSLVFLGQESNLLTINAATAGTRTNSDTTAYRVTGSGSTNRAAISWFHDVASSPFGLLFAIERTKNSDGGDNGDGVWAHLSKYNGSNGTQAFLSIDYNGTYAPVWRESSNGGCVTYLAAASGSYGATIRQAADLSTLHGGKIYAFPLFPFHPGWRYPNMNFLLGSSGDWPVDYSTVTIPFYGSNHSYKPLGPRSNIANAIGSTLTGICVLIRYE